MKDNKLPWRTQFQRIYDAQNEMVLDVATCCSACGQIVTGVTNQNVDLAKLIVDAVNEDGKVLSQDKYDALLKSVDRKKG